MIKLDHITQRFKTPEGGDFYALRDVSLEIHRKEIFGIIGRSGAGKSTLVRCINLLNRPTEGCVTVDGVCLNSLDERDLRKMRQHIAMIFQHFNILSTRTVYENVSFPLELIGLKSEQIRRKVEPLIELVGLTDHLHKYPAQLSGGQKQRVGIARALASDPKVLLSDEATSALDPETTVATLDLLKKINTELGLTIVMITHQMDVVKQICDRVAVMNAGQVVEQGDVLDIFRNPQHETTRKMVGTVMSQTIPPSMVQRLRATLKENSAEQSEHILRLTFIGDEVDRPVISEASRLFNVDLSILLANVDQIQGKNFGTLTVMLQCPQETLEKTVQYLRKQNVTVKEITDYVL